MAAETNEEGAEIVTLLCRSGGSVKEKMPSLVSIDGRSIWWSERLQKLVWSQYTECNVSILFCVQLSLGRIVRAIIYWLSHPRPPFVVCKFKIVIETELLWWRLFLSRCNPGGDLGLSKGFRLTLGIREYAQSALYLLHNCCKKHFV